ncbi:MAG: RiPP maturation radical SAM C-methyltransferase [Nitrospirota bacterium]
MSSNAPVALVNMPFSSGRYPSIQLGTLASLLKAQGIGVKTYHLYLHFAYQIGPPLYETLCEKRGLLGDWLFSHLLFRNNPKNSEYPRTFKPLFESVARETGCPPSYLEELKLKGAPQYLTRMQTEIDWSQYTLVGFTSTFDQNIASLTMAKLIKDIHPSVKIVFGGANFDGEMGLEHLRAWPWIDYVVVGEGEVAFPALARYILENKTGEPPSGVAYRKNGEVQFTPSPHLFTEFHKTGPPDYDDYFELLDQLDPQRSQSLNRILLYEASRGCWWGEKHHCTFCGLNAQSMEFRSKSPAQVFEEFRFLASRYNTTRFRFVDNIIDMKYIDELFAKFAAERLDLEVFIETKSNLSRSQIHTLARGGVKSMQPGIESLSQRQLTEMKKGVSPLQNLQMLKWSGYYGIHVSWNILLGFPGETNEDYRRQIGLIPSILHFQPPEAVGELWLERFSPYWKWPKENGIRITGPGLAHAYVYDPTLVDVSKIAYDFEHELIEKRVDPGLIEELTRATQEWKRRHASNDKPFLYYSKAPDFVTIFDGRVAEKPVKARYDWPHAGIIEFCNEAPRTFGQIRGELNERKGEHAYDDAAVTRALDDLLHKRILYEEKGRHLTLALPVNQSF